MAIFIKTDNPQALLTAICTAATKPNGTLQTWTYDANTQHLFHTPSSGQWNDVAFISQIAVPTATDTASLKFGIILPARIANSRADYSILHGRFIEMLLGHFHTQFSVVWPTKNRAIPDHNHTQALR